jgi:hypothetical protein
MQCLPILSGPPGNSLKLNQVFSPACCFYAG